MFISLFKAAPGMVEGDKKEERVRLLSPPDLARTVPEPTPPRSCASMSVAMKDMAAPNPSTSTKCERVVLALGTCPTCSGCRSKSAASTWRSSPRRRARRSSPSCSPRARGRCHSWRWRRRCSSSCSRTSSRCPSSGSPRKIG